jgi:type III secretory pathway lipoprotein EscJ
MTFVHLTTVGSETEAELLCSLLRSEQIACTQRQHLSPAAYGSTGGTEILVSEADLARALELIEQGAG